MEVVLAEVQERAIHNQGQGTIVGQSNVQGARISFIIHELRKTHICVRVIILWDTVNFASAIMLSVALVCFIFERTS